MPRFCFFIVTFVSFAFPVAAEPFLSVRDFGAMGDGMADDTAAIQKAIDQAGETGGTLHFPPGTYVVTSVGLRPGVRYLGYGATILRPPNQGKWVRTFNAAKVGYLYHGEEDSPVLTIEGLSFDGNRAAQGEYRKYQLEQAHLIFLSAGRESPGRLRARVLNCHFQENVADALSLYTNVDVQVSNCSARDCFRGGITITGGNSRIQIANFTAQGKVHPTGIDVEVDGAGFSGTKRIELSINGMNLPDGDFDIGVSDGSVVLGSNIQARAPFYLYAADSSVRISNSRFGVGEFSGYGNRIVRPGNVVFQNCQFEVDGTSGDEPGRWAAIHVYWNVSGSQHAGQSLKLLDCDFTVAGTIAEADTTYAVYCEGDQSESNNRLIVDGGQISARYDHGVTMFQGGTLRLRDVEIAAANPMRLGSAVGWTIDAEIGGITLAQNVARYAEIPTHGPENRIVHRNVVIDEAANQISTRYGLARNRYIGRRVVLGSKPPTPATHGLLGDVFRLKTPAAGQDFEWICVKTGAGTGALWRVLSRVEP